VGKGEIILGCMYASRQVNYLNERVVETGIREPKLRGDEIGIAGQGPKKW